MLVPEFSYYVELVVWYLKLFVALSVVVIGFVIRRKWRLAVAREVEIKRLMLLAAEEAAKAESEAEAVGYYVNGDAPLTRDVFGFKGEVLVDKGGVKNCPEVAVNGECAEVDEGRVKVYQCEVCLSPTTTRCARCKSARYCSAKCQIFHWRKGHKDECQPPSIENQPSDTDSYSCVKVINQEKDETPSRSFQPEGNLSKHCHTRLEGNEFLGVGQTDQLHGKNDKIKDDYHREVKSSSSTASFTSSSSDSSVSLFSDSSDEASTTAIRSTSDCEKSNGHQRGHRSNHAKSIAKRSIETKPCDVKNSAAAPFIVNLTQPTSKQRDNQKDLHVTDSSYSKASNLFVAKSGESDFWEGALDYRWAESGKSKPYAINDDLSDIGSSLRGSMASFRKTENNYHLDGKLHCSGTSDVFKKIDGVSSEVKIPIQTSSTISRPARGVDGSVKKAVRYNSPAAIISPHNGTSKADDQKLSSSLKADRAINSTSTSSISKPRASFDDKGDGTVYSVKGEKACQVNTVSHSKNASRSSVFSEKHGSALYSNQIDCKVQPMKSRLVGSIPLNSDRVHSSVAHEVKMPSIVSKIVVMKSNNNVETSNTSYSVNAVNSLKSSTWKAVKHFKATKLSSDCGADERHGNKGVFCFELFKSLYRWNKIELQPRGLVNCGNSCYANAVLQCLLFTPPLTAYLLQGLHSKNCTTRDWCFTCEIENLILKQKDGNLPISPIGIISHLPSIGSHLSNGREEDAHEFLRYVVDTMQSVCIKEAANKVAGNVEEETTLLGLTFGGYLQSKIRCMKCGNSSERSERILDLSVEIEGSIQRLESALDRFTRSETLDGENKYNCARCKSYQKAKKRLTVLEAPNILTIALKRFRAGNYGKLNKWVDFPDVLDMSPFMSRKSDDKEPVYNLYGVIVHLDTMNAAFSGHYVCYVKNIQNKWFKIDDSVVKAVDFREVKEQAAYMLLYARRLPKAPKSLRENFVSESKSKFTPMAGRSLIAESDRVTSSEPFCNRHQSTLETDSCSDNYSLFSSGSDEYSCSTDSSSARESNSADDLSDLIFGDSGRGLRYPWTSSSGSNSSSPLSS